MDLHSSSDDALHTLAVSCQAKKQHYVSTFVSTFEIPRHLSRERNRILRKFFHAHNCRSEERIQERIEGIYQATPATKDASVVEAAAKALPGPTLFRRQDRISLSHRAGRPTINDIALVAQHRVLRTEDPTRRQLCRRCRGLLFRRLRSRNWDDYGICKNLRRPPPVSGGHAGHLRGCTEGTCRPRNQAPVCCVNRNAGGRAGPQG